MRFQGSSFTKIVFVVTTLALISACGHKKVKDEGANFQASVDLISPSAEQAASFEPTAEVQIEASPASSPKAARKSIKKSKKKSSKKWVGARVEPTPSAPPVAPAAATVTETESIPASNENPDMKTLSVIDPAELPLSMGAIATPEPPVGLLAQPIYEGFASEGLTLAIVGIAIAAISALIVTLNRRRNRHKLVLN